MNHFLWFNGRWDDVVLLGAWAYEAMHAMNDWSKAGWRAYDVAWIHNNRANRADASLWTDRCADAWARGGSKYEQATGTQMRGLVARQREDYDDAERLYQEALAIYRDLKFDDDVAATLNNLGAVERAGNDDEAAERYYREALALYEKLEKKEGMAALYGNLGLLALQRKQWAEAGEWYEKELTLARDIGRQDLIADAQFGLARVHEEEGRTDLALPLAQEALAIEERLRSTDLAVTRRLVERLRKAVTKS